MTGAVCLQGGGEFAPGCREMDAALVRAFPGPVVVAALAGAPGREYDTAGATAAQHYLAVGARDVRVAPDAREDPDGARRAMAGACVLVLPGGSPSRLLDALQSTPVGERVQQVLDEGGLVVGSSAGAMVVSGWTVLPDRPGMPVVRGLGLVPGVLVAAALDRPAPRLGGGRPVGHAARHSGPRPAGGVGRARAGQPPHRAGAAAVPPRAGGA